MRRFPVFVSVCLVAALLLADPAVTVSQADQAPFDTTTGQRLTVARNVHRSLTRVIGPFAGVDAFVAQQYVDFLGRAADQAGLDYWAQRLSSGADTPASAIESFLNSAEFGTKVAPLARLYWAYFLRLPDYDGLMYWIAKVRTGIPLLAVSDAFAASGEFQRRYGSLDHRAFVTLVYENVLGRAPELDGLAYWTSRLQTGAATRGQVMVGFSESAEYRRLTRAQIEVTMTYVGMLRRVPDPGGYGYWVAAVEGGTSIRQLIGGFLHSAEYAHRFILSFVVGEPIMAATDALVAQHGEAEAAVAVLLAFDSGYSLAQLIAAAAEGTLNPDGTITGVQPEYDPYDLIAPDGPTAPEAYATDVGRTVSAKLMTSVLAAGDPPVTTADALRAAWANQADELYGETGSGSDRAFLAMLFHLSSMGYSAEQIVEGILFGEINWLAFGGEARYGCVGMASDDFGIVPAFPPSNGLSSSCEAVYTALKTREGIFASRTNPPDWRVVAVTTTTTTTTTTRPGVAPFPWTFAGQGTYTAKVTAPQYLEWSHSFELTVKLLESGTVEFSAVLPAGREGLTVDCTNDTIYVSTNFPQAETSWEGTHRDGKLFIGDQELEESSYTEDALIYRRPWEGTFETCIGNVTQQSVWEANLPRLVP